MGYYTVDLPSLTIANGGTTSGALGGFTDARSVVLYAPSALTGTVTIQIEPSASGTSWVDLSSAGSDVTIAAGNAVVLEPLGFRQIRLSSSAAEAAARTFTVTMQIAV